MSELLARPLLRSAAAGPLRRPRSPAALLAAAATAVLSQVPAAAAAPVAPDYSPDSVVVAPGPPAAAATPADGRIDGYGYAATVDGVATTAGTHQVHLATGQRLWVFGVTVHDVPPPFGPPPATVTATVTANGITLPVPLASDGQQAWFDASLPVGTSDVTLQLSSAGVPSGFSLAHLARTSPSPAALYRTPGSWETSATAPDAAVATTFTDTTTQTPEPYTVPIRLVTGELTSFAPDRTGRLPDDPSQSWLVVQLTSFAAKLDTATAGKFVDFDAMLGASAVTLTQPGGSPVPATAATGAAEAKASDPADPYDLFGSLYYWPVPADLSTATLTVTLPASVAAHTDYTGAHGTATFAGPTVTLTVTVPPAAVPPAPAVAATSPATIPDLPATIDGHPATTVALHRIGNVTWLLAAAGAVVIVAAAAAGTGIAVSRRRARHPAAPTGGWSAPPPAPWPVAPAEAEMPRPPTDPPDPAVARTPPGPSTAPNPPSPGGEPAAAAPVPSADEPAPPPVNIAPAAPTSEAARPTVPHGAATPPEPTPTPAELPGPSVRVLGPLRLTGWPDPPPRPLLHPLIAYYALHPGRAIPPDTVRARLAGNGAEISGTTLNTYNSAIRRHLPDSAALTNAGGGVRLDGVATDFAHLAATVAQAAADPDSQAATDALAAALALIDGRPFEDTTWPWIDQENLRTNAEQLATRAATLLAAVAPPALARWGWHRALLANPIDQDAAAGALEAAVEVGGPSAGHLEWRAIVRRLAAHETEPDERLVALYRKLTARPGDHPGPGQ